MNIKMYNTLIKNKKIKKIYNAPSGSDESISIGACYFMNRKLKSFPMRHLSLGLPLIDKKYSIKKIIKNSFNNKFSINFNTKPKSIAKLLLQNEIIAIADGKEEFGARALGNRSIIANPEFFENVKKINLSIKNRDFWMPFALTIKSEKAGKYVHNPKRITSEFMNLSFDTKVSSFEFIKAGCHPYDKSVRPQIISKNQNRNFYEILSEFGKISNCYALLNTSLNLHGSPKCSDIFDVIKTFKNSGLKYLYLNNKILIKKNKYFK